MSVSSSKPVEVGHTPETWDLCEAHPAKLGARVVSGCDVVATVPGGFGRCATKKGKARARLISAAPDLLEACKRLLAAHSIICEGDSHDGMGEDDDCKAARAAIAKAGGVS